MKEPVKLEVQSLKHTNALADVSLKQNHVLQVQNIRHTLNISLGGGKLHGKINSQ